MSKLPFIVWITNAEKIDPKVAKIFEGLAEIKLGRLREGYRGKELIKMLEDVDAAIITSRARFTQEALLSAPKLKVVCKEGAKPEPQLCDLETCNKKGIVLTYSKGSNKVSVAEHVITMILSLAKTLNKKQRWIKEGGWKSEEIIGMELAGKTIGIIGFGLVGTAIAERFQNGWNVRILVYDPYVSKKNIEAFGGIKVDKLETFLKESDFVSVNTILTEETRGMIGESELRIMKPTAYIINTARGAIIDEKALIKALQEKWIAGAGLDVFEIEPPDEDNPLLKMGDNVIVTPHAAFNTYEAIERERVWAAEEVARVLHREEPKWAINPEVLKRK